MRATIHSHIGLRGVAACGVIGAHIGAPHIFFAGSNPALFPRGYLLVDLFFVLSGFIMSYTYLDAFRSAPTAEFHRRFLVARVARIYPLHVSMLLYMGVLFTAELFAQSRLGTPTPFAVPLDLAFLKQLFLLNIWTTEPTLAWNFPSWSISAEMAVYLIFPLLAALFTLPPAIRRGTAVLALLGYYGAVGLATGSLDVIGWQAAPRCLAGFLFGMLLHDLHRSISPLPSGWLGAIQFGALAVCVTGIARGWHDVLFIPAFGLIAFATIDGRGPVAAALRMPAAKWLGERSYSIYLAHIPVLYTVGPIVQRLGPAPRGWSLAAYNLCLLLLVLAAAHVLLRFVELPGRRHLRALLDERPVGPVRADQTPP